MEEYELMKDSKYRVYVSAVDKALKNFEYTSEWADLISALGKLNKVLSSHMKFQVIPRRIKISKRLAQCMHPALPSGVHLKALETYDIIFKCMGTSRLSHELFIYSAGLFPLLGHAAMNVRPSLLTVYETHFVPLGERLCPALSGFLSGVLPGLEEGSDHFDRTNSLLEKVCDGVGAARFYTCLWDCLSSNSLIRLPAICFILSHFNKKLTMEDQLHIMGTDVDGMVNGLCAGVQDSSVLVQRSALDLLLVGFPLHNSQLVRSDMIRLVTASLNTILRRDMSLNRRLFAWLLGSEVNLSLLNPDHPLIKSPSVSYFQLYSQEMLIMGIRTLLNQVLADIPHDLRPFRILGSLLDKPEIGPVILDHILYEVFRTLYLASMHSKVATRRSKDPQQRTMSQTSGQQELFKSVNLLFSSLEPAYIWQYAGSLLERACHLLQDTVYDSNEENDTADNVRPVGSGQPCLIEVCQLVSCLLDAVSLESYIDTTMEHLPKLFLQIVKQLFSPSITFTPRALTMCLQLCSKVLSRVQPEPSSSKGPGFSDSTRPRSKTVSFGQRRNSDSSQTLVLETNVDRLKDLSLSDHHLESDANLKMEITSRSASVGARLEADQSISTHILGSKRQGDGASEGKVDFQAFPPNPILDECRKLYQEVFVVLISSDRMIEWKSNDFQKLFKYLSVDSCSELEGDDATGLEKLLKACISNTQSDFDSSQSLKKTQIRSFRFKNWKDSGVLDEANQLQAPSNEWEEVFCAACSLLVDLSTFPSSCQPLKIISSSNSKEIPQWLQLLTVCCCWLGQSPSMQLTAISTLLDLISVASKNGQIQVTSEENSQVTPVVLTSLLLQDDVQILENFTCVMQVIAHWLWHHLSVGGPLEARSVALFQQLHDTIAADDVVEATIGEFITQDDDEAQLKGFHTFATLWHATREITKRGKRPFVKSLLRMLALPDSSPLRLAAQGWLLHALLQGDVPRLLDPLLLPLLAPTTARVSVLRVSIQHRSTVLPNEADKAEARIYAISSEDGNVIYHVSPMQSSEKSKQSLSSDSVRARRIFTVSNLVKHCTYEKDDISLEYCPSSLKSWAIPSAVTGNFSVTTADNDSPSGSSSSASSSTSSGSGPPHSSVSLSEDQQRTSRSPAFQSGELLSSSANVMVRVDGRLVVENPVLKSMSSGFEDGDDDDLADRISNQTSRGNTPILNNGEGELEESYSAEDYFSRTGFRPRSRTESSGAMTTSILKNGIDSLLSEVKSVSSEKRKSSSDFPSPLTLHPLHSHMLLYCGVYDSARTLYTLRTLRNTLATNPRIFLSCAATTGVTRTSSDLLNLLARHRKSASGNNFQGDLANGSGGSGRSHMYLEVLLLTCLYYIRSYYPSLGQMRLTKQEIEGNQQVQIACIELLTLILSELTSIVRDSGKGLANYISDLMARCKVQKVVLHCLVASVHDCASTSTSRSNLTFTEEIINFNDPGRVRGEHHVMSPLGEAYQIQLLRLLLALIILEHQVHHQRSDVSTQHTAPSNSTSSTAPPSLSVTNSQTCGDIAASAPQKHSELKYLVGRPISQQPMFVAAVLSALRMQGQLRWLHQQWTTLVTCCLPFMGQSLAHVVLSVVRQLCDNLRALAPLYANTLSTSERISLRLPADYTVTQLEALTILCHYCLLDRNQQHALNQPLLTASAAGSLSVSSNGVNAAVPPSHAAQIFNNLVHVFMTTPLHHDTAQENVEPQLAARRALLYNLPQIISSTASLWKAVMTCSDKDQEWCSIAGNARIVRHHLLEFLSPISLHHATNFLAAVAVVWQDRRVNLPEPASLNTVTFDVVPEQRVLVELISAIRVMPVDTLVQTLHQLVKSPPSVHGTHHSVCLEVSALELLLCYLRQGGSPPLLLAESWSSVLLLLRDGLQPGLPAPAQFLLLAVLNEFVQRCPSPSEKKDLRDLQDITTKLVESCGSIAGACLEQTTWLRRNLAVKEDQLSQGESVRTAGSGTTSQFSIQAQTVLAEQLASLLDVTFGSQEKEKVVNILTSLLYNIIPYLRNHSPRNAASFNACSELLASLTAFQYTRKAWRRDVLDLLLEPALFQMEAKSLPHWRTIIDNLMSHDTTTFRDLMSRVSLGQGNSLSLFSSREQEYEQRAHLLKRLAFVILCGEMDQYQKYMPEIQERLAESLRLPQVVPAVQANVFLCFRVLLLRMSPHHVTSLWPVIISEMVQVFLQMEQELSTESEEFSSYIRLMSGLDLAWVSDRSNGLHARGHPHWLQLQLAAAHLLHLALQLPAHRLPQFQMYRWAFVGSLESTGLNNNNSSVMGCLSSVPVTEDDHGRSLQFIPHVSRIARLMDAKFEGPVELPLGSALLPSTQMVRCLQELHPFFSIVSSTGGRAISASAGTLPALEDLEKAIELDFLEPMPSR